MAAETVVTMTAEAVVEEITAEIAVEIVMDVASIFSVVAIVEAIMNVVSRNVLILVNHHVAQEHLVIALDREFSHSVIAKLY